jgi:hypothetical protein
VHKIHLSRACLSALLLQLGHTSHFSPFPNNAMSESQERD